MKTRFQIDGCIAHCECFEQHSVCVGAFACIRRGERGIGSWIMHIFHLQFGWAVHTHVHNTHTHTFFKNALFVRLTFLFTMNHATAIQRYTDTCMFWWQHRRAHTHAAFHAAEPDVSICAMCMAHSFEFIHRAYKTLLSDNFTLAQERPRGRYDNILEIRLLRWIDDWERQGVLATIRDLPIVFRQFIDEGTMLIRSVQWEKQRMHEGGSRNNAIATLPALIRAIRFVLLATGRSPAGQAMLMFMKGPKFDEWETAANRLHRACTIARTLASFGARAAAQASYESSPVFKSAFRDFHRLSPTNQRDALVQRLFHTHRIWQLNGNQMAKVFVFTESQIADSIYIACSAIVQLWMDLLAGVVPAPLLVDDNNADLPPNISSNCLDMDAIISKFHVATKGHTSPFAFTHRTILAVSADQLTLYVNMLRQILESAAMPHNAVSTAPIENIHQMFRLNASGLHKHLLETRKTRQGWQNTGIELHSIRHETAHACDIVVHDELIAPPPPMHDSSMLHMHVIPMATMINRMSELHTLLGLPATVTVITATGTPGIVQTLNAEYEREVVLGVDYPQKALYDTIERYLTAYESHIHTSIETIMTDWGIIVE